MSTSAKRSGALLVLGGAVLLAAAVIAVVVLTREPAPVVAPPSPSPTPTATAVPVVQPEPFDVELRGVGVQEMGNGWIYRRRSGNTRKGATKHARAALAELTRYLNRALVNPQTRFTDDPVNRLLTRGAEQELNRRGRRALGVGAPPIVGGRTRKASARAVVLYDGQDAHAVTINYRARLNVRLVGEKKRQPLRQSGVMVFVRTKAGWRADMVDVRTELPRPMVDVRTEPPRPPAEQAAGDAS